MGFGFVVARFGLFLRQIQLVNHEMPAQNFGPSPWFGTALIAEGVFVNVLARYRHVHLVRGLEQGDLKEFHRKTPAVGVALFPAIVGLAMSIYLVTIRE